MRWLLPAMLAAGLAAAESDPVVLAVADASVLEAHADASVFGRVWAEPVAAPLRQWLGRELAMQSARRDVDVQVALRALRGLQLRYCGTDARGRGRWAAQTDLGTMAPRLARRLNGGRRGQPVAVPGADEAWALSGNVIARFGGIVACGRPPDILPLAPMRAGGDVELHLDLPAVFRHLAVELHEPDRARLAPLLDFCGRHSSRLTVRVDLAADGLDSRVGLEADLLAFRAADRRLLARLPATTLAATVIGLDGPAMWRRWGGELPAAIAPLLHGRGLGDLIGQVGWRGLIEGLDGSVLIAQTPGMPFPGVSVAVPRSPALDALVQGVCRQLGCVPPAAGASALLPIPDVPLPIQIACDAGHWIVSTDMLVAAGWPAGAPGGFAEAPLGRELLRRAPEGACQLGAFDAAAELRMLLGPFNMLLGEEDGFEVAEKQALMSTLLRLAAAIPPGYHWAELRDGRFQGRGCGGDPLWPALPVAAAVICVPGLLESRLAANELAAATTLRQSIFPAQIQFQAGCYHDEDADNLGAYGLLSELAGRRGMAKVKAGELRLLAGPLRNDDFAVGYRFAGWLPDGRGGAVGEPADDQPRPGIIAPGVDADQQEAHFVVYAWPDDAESGGMMFAIDERGLVHEAPWTGQPPRWNDLYGPGGFGDEPVWERRE